MDDPTSSCTPLYQEPYFIFDREDLRTLSTQGDLTTVSSADGRTVGLYASEFRTRTDIIFWSCFVLVLCILLLSLTFFCHCCLGYFNRGTSTRRKNGTMPFLMVFGCGILTGAVILITFAGSGVLLWLETDLNQNLTDQADTVQYYINITTQLSQGDNNTVRQITLDPLFQVHNIRFWISLGVLGSMVVILAIMFLSVCICTPFSKSSAPMVTMLIVEIVFTLLTSIIASVLFGIMLFFSIVCYDLYRLGGNRWCDDRSNGPLERSLGNFCGQQTITKFYAITGTYGILIIFLVVVQFFGSVYTVVVTKGYKDQPSRHTRQTPAAQQRQHTQISAQPHREQQRRPSRNQALRSTSPYSTGLTGATGLAMDDRLSARVQRGRHQRRHLNSSTAAAFRDTERDMRSQNAFKMSSITYPTEAPPSYDDVIRRDSETGSSTPLLSPGSAARLGSRGLGGVPEEEEDSEHSHQREVETSHLAAQDSGAHLQETTPTLEERASAQ